MKFEDELDEHSEEHSETPFEKVVIEKHTPLVALPSFTNVHCTSLDIASDENAFHMIEHHHFVRILTREGIEERAWKEAKEKFSDRNPADVLPPPMPVDISGLFILITEVDVDWMPKDLINDPLGCIQFLQKMMDEGTLGMKLISSFGEWYINDNMVFIVILYLFMPFHVLHCFWHTLI